MTTAFVTDTASLLAEELKLPVRGIAATLQLLAEGATVPFIARYRKEITGSLDEVQIRAIQERYEYIQELDKRRVAILASITEQGKLSPELEAAIRACTSKTVLEDLYLPYKPKRRTRAQMARERGLEPLAAKILLQPTHGEPRREAEAFVDGDKGVKDADAALAGARDIIAEMLSEHAELRARLRILLGKEGMVVSQAIPAATQQPTKFEQYYDFREAIRTIPSHRYLAIRRGEKEEVLKVALELDAAEPLRIIQRAFRLNPASPFAVELRAALEDGYQRLLFPSLENEQLNELKERSDLTAVETFASNLQNLLLASPLGMRAVMGIDPGFRTGCKCVTLDATGKFLANVTIYPGQGARKDEQARQDLLLLVKKYQPTAIAIGNGTGSREVEAFVRACLREAKLDVTVLQVNEAGASVYSASDIARDEFPDLDLTVRGAISIARRLQDPLAELVKIEPKAIGVGQYQHDVQQTLLQRKLGDVVESCVNRVGVDLNTASAALLSYVSGIGPALAKKIVAHRDQQGAFAERKQILKVAGFGKKAFEQAAGFLRIREGKNPLDASAVHPERYTLVETMAKDLGVPLKTLVGNDRLAQGIDLKRYISPEVGEPTLKDILVELQKPGRDPRSEFVAPVFRDDVHSLNDLKPGMQFEGMVTNVTAFGAFVDIGVHQDGLVHISQLADRYVKDPHSVVAVGQRLKVRVLEVDVPRKRIQLTAKSQ
jgi:uncharacterized protein